MRPGFVFRLPASGFVPARRDYAVTSRRDKSDYAVAGGGIPRGRDRLQDGGAGNACRRKCLSPEMPGGFNAEIAEKAEGG